jgi:ComF family protein
MINNLLQIIAPHHCYGCTKIGHVLCDNCKYDIIDEAVDACIMCDMPAPDGICRSCRTSYEKAWCVGDRLGPLMATIDGLKFNHVKDAARPLAALLDARMPVLPPNAVIVPIPTIPAHIRQRGYDHTLLIARLLARQRNLSVKQLLLRKKHDVQRGKSKKQRLEQARVAYECRTELSDNVPYLLIDDVVTTNATLRYAAEALRAAGAKTIWVGVVARQPLDK